MSNENEYATLDEALGISERLAGSDQLRLISLLSERLSRELEPLLPGAA